MITLLLMCAVLGASSLAVGMLPLTYAFSKTHLERLSIVGTGLLLGAALGVIIPEGLENISDANPKGLPVNSIALSLVLGFLFMLFIEQVVAPDGHSHSASTGIPKSRSNNAELEFDAELGDLDHNGRSSEQRENTMTSALESVGGKGRAFSLLLGLSVHGMADGLALGVASLSRTGGNTLPFVVFLALALHKAPTSLAFTTSILSTNLPRELCKKYVAVFSSSTPVAALASYWLLTYFGTGNEQNLVGLALLASGGTFLYVATVLQPVLNHGETPGDMRPATRVFFIAIGMLIPVVLGAMFSEHGH
ncbi:Zinc/iron permease [Panaeolus papilionaceus]|nr:Zinc/iron permease [Panaeolus papilionaceus]